MNIIENLKSVFDVDQPVNVVRRQVLQALASGLVASCTEQPKPKIVKEVEKAWEVQLELMRMDQLIGEKNWERVLGKLYGALDPTIGLAMYRPWVLAEDKFVVLRELEQKGDLKGMEAVWPESFLKGFPTLVSPDEYSKIGRSKGIWHRINKMVGGEIDPTQVELASREVDRVMGKRVPEDLNWVFAPSTEESDGFLWKGARGVFADGYCDPSSCKDNTIATLEDDAMKIHINRQRLYSHEGMHYWDIVINPSLRGWLSPAELVCASFYRALALADDDFGRAYPQDLVAIVGNKDQDTSNLYPNNNWLKGVNTQLINTHSSFLYDYKRSSVPTEPDLVEWVNLQPGLKESLGERLMWPLVWQELQGVGKLKIEVLRTLANKQDDKPLSSQDYVRALERWADVVLLKFAYDGTLSTEELSYLAWGKDFAQNSLAIAWCLLSADQEKLPEQVTYHFSPSLRRPQLRHELEQLVRENPALRYYQFITQKTGAKFIVE